MRTETPDVVCTNGSPAAGGSPAAASTDSSSESSVPVSSSHGPCAASAWTSLPPTTEYSRNR
jgi:hypothetical protein